MIKRPPAGACGEKKLILKYLECIRILFVVFYKDRLKKHRTLGW